MIVLISNINAFRQSTSETMKPEKIQRREVLEAGAEEGPRGQDASRKLVEALSTNILPPKSPSAKRRFMDGENPLQRGLGFPQDSHILLAAECRPRSADQCQSVDEEGAQ